MRRTADTPEPSLTATRGLPVAAGPPGEPTGSAPTALESGAAAEQTAEGTAPRSAPTERPNRPARLPQLDVMRLIVCFFVVATHVVSNVNPEESVAPNLVAHLLHFTRQAFFFISALVLVHSSWGRVRPDGRLVEQPGQMRRRVSVLGVPYLWWSACYVLLGLAMAYSAWALHRVWWTYLAGLIQGSDGYHMYFLLVSVEFAVVFPLFVRLLHATRGRHGLLLIVSGLIEAALMAVFHYVGQPQDWWRPIIGEASLTAYQFWVVLGGVAALHFTEMHDWLVRHTRLVLAALPASVALAVVVFWAELAAGEQPEFAGRSLQPVTIPLALATIGALYLLSVRITAIRDPRVHRWLAAGTYLSFGIYLSHPAILSILLRERNRIPGLGTGHPVLATTLILLLDFVLALVVSQVLSRTPFSKALTGRPTRRRVSSAAAVTDRRSSDLPSPGPVPTSGSPAPAAPASSGRGAPSRPTRAAAPGGRSEPARRARSSSSATRHAAQG